MNRQWRTRLALLTAALVLIAPSLVNSAGAQSAAGTSPIYVGQVVPETGVGAETGVFQLNGAHLAISQINAHGGINGRPLKLEVQDDQTTNAGASLRTAPLFETGDPRYIWLTRLQAVGVGERVGTMVKYDIYALK